MTEIIDLTLEQYEGNPTHPGHGRTPLLLRGTVSHGTTFQRGIRNPYDGSAVSVANEYVLLTGHTGTHVDAPYHVDHRSLLTVEKVPLARTFGSAVWLDLAHRGTRGATIEAADLIAAEAAGGEPIRPGDIVLVRTGWLDAHEHDMPACIDGAPGLTRAAGEWLRDRGIGALGVDMVSPDLRTALDLPIHLNFLRPQSVGLDPSAYILIFENLRNIGAIPRRRFTFSGLPLPVRGATASPVRAVALVD
jgi:kynurenine formamidase